VTVFATASKEIGRECAASAVKTCQRLVDWGVGEDDCEAFLYWDQANPVASSEKDVFVTAYRRSKKLLCVVANWTDADSEVTLTLDGLAAVKDLESGLDLGVVGERVKLTVGRHDFALVEAEARPRQ